MRVILNLQKLSLLFFLLVLSCSVCFAQSDQQLQIRTTETQNAQSGDCSMNIDGNIITGVIENGICTIPQDAAITITPSPTPTPTPIQNTSVVGIINNFLGNKDCDSKIKNCDQNIIDIIFNFFGIKIPDSIRGSVNSFSSFIITLGTISSIAVITSPIFLLTYAPNLFFSSAFIIFYVKKSKPWGLIYDEETNQPIPFAVIRLLNATTNMFVKDTVSDMNGRFTFTAEKGKYFLEIRAIGYQTIMTRPTPLAGEIYSGEIINIPQDGLGISVKVPLVKEGVSLNFWQKVVRFFRYNLPKFFENILFITIIFLVVQFIFVSSLINLALLMFYLILYFYISKNKNKYYSSNGFVYDVENKLGLQGAFVKMLNDKGDLSADLILTDNKGHFDILADDGAYKLQIDYLTKAVTVFNDSSNVANPIPLSYTTKLKMKVGLSETPDPTSAPFSNIPTPTETAQTNTTLNPTKES